MPFFRSCVFFLGYFVLTVSYGTLSLLTWALPPLLRHRIIATWTRLVVLWLKLSCGVQYHIVGKENLTSTSNPQVILSKHQSAWETLFLQSLFWPAATVLKKELLRIPFFGWGLRAMNPIAIDRSNPRAALKKVKSEGLKRIAKGMNLILFPEGTRMRPGEKGTYARSGADIAAYSMVDIIPVALNAAKCWPSKRFVKYPGTITVSLGPAIKTNEKSSKEIMQEVETWIEAEMVRISKN